jgi:hypothetical protein
MMRREEVRGMREVNSTNNAEMAEQPPAQPAEQPPAQPAEQPPAQPAEQPPAQPAEQPPAQPAEQPPAEPAERSLGESEGMFRKGVDVLPTHNVDSEDAPGMGGLPAAQASSPDTSQASGDDGGASPSQTDGE